MEAISGVLHAIAEEIASGSGQMGIAERRDLSTRILVAASMVTIGIIEVENESNLWFEEATYEVGGVPHHWSVRAIAAEKKLSDAGMDWYCGGVSPSSVKPTKSWHDLNVEVAKLGTVVETLTHALILMAQTGSEI